MYSFHLIEQCFMIIFVMFHLNINFITSFLYEQHLGKPRIQKCCNPDEQLTTDFICMPIADKNYTQPSNYSDSFDYNEDILIVDEYPKWLGENVFLSSENLNPVLFSPKNFSMNFSFSYGKIPCELNDYADLKLFSTDDMLYILDNGSLLFQKDGLNKTLPHDSYCVDKLVAEDMAVHVAFLCPCDSVMCFRKCCFGDFVLIETYNKWICEKADNVSWKSHLWKFNEGGDYHQINKFPVCDLERDYYVVNGEESSDVSTDFIVLKDGGLEYNGLYYPEHSYCGEVTMFSSGKVIPNILTCKKNDLPMAYQHVIYGSLYFFGSIFLLCTLCVHAIFPELRKKVHAYNLIAHVSCLLIGYIVHCFASLGTSLIRDTVVCNLVGIVLQFSFLASFFWMNVLCIDISLAFSQLKPLQSIRGKSEKKKFIYYSLYAWGTSSLISVLTIAAEYTKILPFEYRPNFGKQSCWFQGKIPTGIYFYFPITILFVINILLFLNTSVKIFVAHRDVASLTPGSVHLHEGRTKSRRRNRFILYLKLFCLMGVLWILEIVDEYFIESPYITITVDSLNLLRAFFIFIIFCWKEKVLRLFKEKMCKAKENKQRNMSKKSTSFKTSSRTGSFQLSNINSVSQNVEERDVK